MCLLWLCPAVWRRNRVVYIVAFSDALYCLCSCPLHVIFIILLMYRSFQFHILLSFCFRCMNIFKFCFFSGKGKGKGAEKKREGKKDKMKEGEGWEEN